MSGNFSFLILSPLRVCTSFRLSGSSLLLVRASWPVLDTCSTARPVAISVMVTFGSLYLPVLRRAISPGPSGQLAASLYSFARWCQTFSSMAWTWPQEISPHLSCSVPSLSPWRRSASASSAVSWSSPPTSWSSRCSGCPVRSRRRSSGSPGAERRRRRQRRRKRKRWRRDRNK